MVADLLCVERARIPPVAEEVARSQKGVAIAMFAVGGVCLVEIVSDLLTKRHSAADAVLDCTELAGIAVGGGLLVLMFALLGRRYLRRARRVLRAAHVAAEDPGYTWFLGGRVISCTDAKGAADPSLSFRISPKLVTVLAAVPPAVAAEWARERDGA